MSERGALTSLGHRMVRGAAWVVGLRVAIRLIGVVSTMILARLLVPADFGVVALAMLVMASVELLGSLNFEVWLIRHPSPERDHYNTIWTLTIIHGLVTGALMLALAHPASIFFDEPRLSAVLIVLAVATAVVAFHNVGVVDFQKHLRFDRDFALLFGTKVGAFVVTIGLALIFRSYWALIAGLVANRAVKLVLSYRLHPHRPRLCLRYWREAVGFSKWLLVNNVLGFLYVRADTFVIGKLLNSQAVGLYSVAHEIANLAVSELVTPIRRVMLPGYSQMSDDRATLRRGFVEGFAIILFIGLPCAAGVGLVAEPLVRVMLGDKWLDAIPLVQILAIYGISAVAMANQTPLLLAMGYARFLCGLYALGLVILVPALVWATTTYGVVGTAAALGAANMLVFVITLAATLRIMEIPLSSIVRRTWRAAAAAALMALSVYGVQSSPGVEGLWPVATLLISVLAGALVYLGGSLLLWRLAGRVDGPEKIILHYLGETRVRLSGT